MKFMKSYEANLLFQKITFPISENYVHLIITEQYEL